MHHTCAIMQGGEKNSGKTGETIKEINKKDCIIWGTDNNGQVAQENKDKKEKNKCVGRWAMAKNGERKWNKASSEMQ